MIKQINFLEKKQFFSDSLSNSQSLPSSIYCPYFKLGNTVKLPASDFLLKSRAEEGEKPNKGGIRSKLFIVSFPHHLLKSVILILNCFKAHLTKKYHTSDSQAVGFFQLVCCKFLLPWIFSFYCNTSVLISTCISCYEPYPIFEIYEDYVSISL